jgi:hypothetical protein
MSGLSEILGDMQAEWSRLQARWQVTREQWRDEVADSFERGRWQEWDRQAPTFLRALEDLEETASRALQDTG